MHQVPFNDPRAPRRRAGAAGGTETEFAFDSGIGPDAEGLHAARRLRNFSVTFDLPNGQLVFGQ